MSQHITDGFNIVGISVRTSNNNGIGSQDIPKLWQQFLSENIHDKVLNKIDNAIYCIYTEYEGDYTKPYTAILGYRVENFDVVPEGLIARSFSNEVFYKYLASGNMFEGSVFKKWQEIWSLDIKRKYTYDYEVYSAKAQLNPHDADVEIYIATK